MRLSSDVECRLDDHLSVRLNAKGHELWLTFSCEGVTQQLSVVRGAAMPGGLLGPDSALASSRPSAGSSREVG